MMTTALVEFPDDVSLLLQCGMWAADEDTLRILGSTGRIEVPSAFFCAAGAEGFRVMSDLRQRYESVSNTDHYTLQADRMADAVLDGSQLRYSELDPVAGAAALEALTRSWQTRERVVLETRSVGQT